jgi:hypothetical protein
MRTMMLTSVSGKAAASRAGRRVQDAGRNPAEVDEVGDPLHGLAEVGLHQPPVMGQVAEPASQRQLLPPQRDHRLRQSPDRVPGSGAPLYVAVDVDRAGHHRETMTSAIRRHRPYPTSGIAWRAHHYG